MLPGYIQIMLWYYVPLLCDIFVTRGSFHLTIKRDKIDQNRPLTIDVVLVSFWYF